MRRAVAAVLLAALAGCDGPGGKADESGANAAANQAGDQASSMVRFVNSRQNAVSDSLRRAYVDFSFDYPSTWTVTPPRTDGGERNFVRLGAPPVDGREPFTFIVGIAAASGDAERDRREIERALPQVAERFGAEMQDYRVASVGRGRVGPHDSWSWRFSAIAPAQRGARPARINGRGDIVVPPGADRGLLVVSFVTDRSNELTIPAQVGERGTLKAVYDSFRIGDGHGG